MGLGYFFGYQSVQIVMGFVDLEWIFFFFLDVFKGFDWIIKW